jgi:KDO2-lipid IV(A) lauroyltransferase
MTVHESVIRDVLRLFVWFPLRWMISATPVNVALFIFMIIGDLHCWSGGKKKLGVFSNIKNRIGSDRKTTGGIVRRYYETHYIDRLHIFLYPKLNTRKKIERYVYIENIEALERELQNGKGVMVVQPHFGPVQITLLTLSLLGYNPIQIGYPTDKGLSRIGRNVAYRYRLKYEAVLPAPIIPADEYMGKVYKHLVKGGVVLTTGDGAGGGIFLGEHRNFRFLGTERMIPLGPASWAVRTGAAFIPTFIIIDGYDRFRIVFEDPITGIHNDIEKDVVYMTERFVSVAEGYIKKYPYCWHFWDEIQNY